MLHSLKAMVDRLLKRDPDGPSPSVFGPNADRLRADLWSACELDVGASRDDSGAIPKVA